MRRSPRLSLSIHLLLALVLACTGVTGARAQFTAAAPQQRQMPDVVGLTQSQAAGRLKQLGLSVTTRSVPSATPQGTVTSQSPEAGTVIRQGETATLEVSTGQAPQETQPSGQTSGGRTRTDGGIDVRVTPPRPGMVPDLTGMSLSMARIRLLASGLALGAHDSAWVEGARGGRVVRQEPAAGTQILPGRRVNVTLARRAPPVAQPDPQTQPRPDLVIVPDLRALTEAQARATLGRARLLLGAADSSETGFTAPGTVFAQKPAAGDSVPPGTFVTITLTRSAGVAMPSLVGRPVAEARRVLAAAGLRAGGVTQREAQGAAGRVLTQSIPAGTRVRPGALVDLAVSRVPAARADTPVVADNPPVVQRDTPSRPAQQDTPAATQPARPDTSPVRQPVDSVVVPAVNLPPVIPPAVTQAPQTTPQPVNRPARAASTPERGGIPREAIWGLIALLVLVAGAVLYRWAKRGAGPEPVPQPEAVPAVVTPPFPGAVRMRVGAGEWESASHAEGRVQRGKIQLHVRIADPRPEGEPAGQALAAGRVAVRTVDAGAPTLETDGAAPVRADGAVQVRVRDDGAPGFNTDGESPVILARES
ncbi:MAG TPA: PASTA domain-containing protein [Longimicrobium sp.]|nr:PASTA domain-containing protein [Longimicrobium sp.]